MFEGVYPSLSWLFRSAPLELEKNRCSFLFFSLYTQNLMSTEYLIIHYKYLWQTLPKFFKIWKNKIKYVSFYVLNPCNLFHPFISVPLRCYLIFDDYNTYSPFISFLPFRSVTYISTLEQKFFAYILNLFLRSVPLVMTQSQYKSIFFIRSVGI
jgi:hypothetical protein